MPHDKPTDPGSLVTRKEIQTMLGRSRAAVYEMVGRAGFPRPIDDGDDHKHPIWNRGEVRAWAEGQGYEVNDVAA